MARKAPSDGYIHGESPWGPLLKEYIYDDEHGYPYHKVERRKSLVEGERDQFPQFHWIWGKNGKGYWKGGEPETFIPYFLPPLIKLALDIPIFFCEGEKDAETVFDLGGGGLYSTTAPGGAHRPWGEKFKNF